MEESKEICTVVPFGQKGFEGLVYGMGFLVNDRDILTCAHVIEAALGTDWQNGDGRVRVCFPFSATPEGEFVSVTGLVDRQRWFPKGSPKPGKPTDIAVIVLEAAAPKSVKRGVLLKGPVDSDVRVKIYGFPGKETPDGKIVSHPTGLYVEGKIVGDLPSGRVQFQGTWETGTAVQRGFSGAGVYDRARDSILGMVVRADRDLATKIAEFIGAPSLRDALGTPAAAPGAESIQMTRSIPQWLHEQTVSKKLEIEAYLEEVGEMLPEPDPDRGLAGLLEEILFHGPDAARLRAAFGFAAKEGDLRSWLQSMKDGSPEVQPLWGKWAQRVDQALWRYGYTLPYIGAEWVQAVRDRVRELRTICEPHRLAKQPTLQEISEFLSRGSQLTPFIEYTPDAELYAVMRSFREPPTATSPRGDRVGQPEPDSGPALRFLLDYLDALQKNTRQIDDSSNAWWAVRIGICRSDERFREPLQFVADKYGAAPQVPPPLVQAANPMPEIYQPVSTVSYTLSNAQAILECDRGLGEGIKNRLHEVIANMLERLLATPVSRNLYLASVHQEGLRNYLDYLKDQEIAIEPAPAAETASPAVKKKRTTRKKG